MVLLERWDAILAKSGVPAVFYVKTPIIFSKNGQKFDEMFAISDQM